MGGRAAPVAGARGRADRQDARDERLAPLAALPGQVWQRVETRIEAALAEIERVVAIMLETPAPEPDVAAARRACAALATRLGRLGFAAAAEIGHRLEGAFEDGKGIAADGVELADLVDDLRMAVRGHAAEIVLAGRAGSRLLVVGRPSEPVDEVLWVALVQGFVIEHSGGDQPGGAVEPEAVLVCLAEDEAPVAAVIVRSIAEQHPRAPIVAALEPAAREHRARRARSGPGRPGPADQHGARAMVAGHATAIVELGQAPSSLLDEVRRAIACARRSPVAVVLGPASEGLADGLETRGVATLRAATPEDALSALRQQDEADRALVADAGGRLDSVATLLGLLRSDPETRSTPALVVGRSTSAATRLRAWHNGIDDLVAPDTDPDELAARVRRAMRRHGEIAPFVDPTRERAALSWHSADLLIQRTLVHALRRRLRVALAVVSVGRAAHAGAAVDAIAETLLDEFRAEDVVARMDDRHLVVCLPGAGSRVVVRRLEAILATLDLPPGACRVGVAEFPVEGRATDELIGAATAAIARAAKANGPAIVGADWVPESLRAPDVMLVEGDEVLGPGLADIVAGAGHRAVWLPSGDEALTVLEEGGLASCPRAALVEFDLPGLAGLQLLARLGGLGLLGHLKVIMLTSRVRDSDLRRAFALGAVDVVTKPVSPLLLLHRLTRVLET
jgi:DNA-binding response OmpR family regulator